MARKSSTTAAAPAPSSTAARGRGKGGSTVSDAEAAPAVNQIRYPCLMNMDYHAAREAWLDQVHRWLMFGVIIAGASALVDLVPGLRIWGPAFALVAGALDLTFDLSNRARTHANFKRRYADILASASRPGADLVALQCKLDEICGEETPPYNALLAKCAEKAQQATYGAVTDPCRPGFWRSLLANILRFDGHDFNHAEPAKA